MSHCIASLFADVATPNANTVWIVIIALGSVGANIATIGMWLNSRKKQETEISPQPLLVAMEKEFTTKREFEKHQDDNKKEHENIFSKIGGVERGASGRLEVQLTELRSENRRDRGEMYAKINGACENIAGLQSTTELQNQSLSAIQSDVKRLLERGRS